MILTSIIQSISYLTIKNVCTHFLTYFNMDLDEMEAATTCWLVQAHAQFQGENSTVAFFCLFVGFFFL